MKRLQECYVMSSKDRATYPYHKRTFLCGSYIRCTVGSDPILLFLSYNYVPKAVF